MIAILFKKAQHPNSFLPSLCRSAGLCSRSCSRTRLSAGSYTSALHFVSSSWWTCSLSLCPPSATSLASLVCLHKRDGRLASAWLHCSVNNIICKLCNHFLRTTLNKLTSLLFSSFSSFRSHICPQPHLHPSWHFLRPNYSWRPGAFTVQIQDSGTTQFIQLSRILYTILVIQIAMYFLCVVDADVVFFPSTPIGRMLCCTGIHLHDHEFVIYHHWLGNWRV